MVLAGSAIGIVIIEDYRCGSSYFMYDVGPCKNQENASGMILVQKIKVQENNRKN